MTAEERLTCAVNDLLAWLSRTQGFVYFHVPNEGGVRLPPAVCAKRKRMGVKAGVPDMIIIEQGGHVIQIELKTAKGTLSDKQKEWRDFCHDLDIPYYICRSVEDVQDVLQKELRNAA